MDVGERIEEIFAGVGLTASLHVVDLDAVDLDVGSSGGGVREVDVRADEQVVIASIFKILLVLEFARQVVAGQLDPTERILVTADDRLGGWGLAGCTDDAEVSLRDLAYFAMSVSDNTAADLLLRRVGPDLLPMLAVELGLTRTQIRGGPGTSSRRCSTTWVRVPKPNLLGSFPRCRRSGSGPCGCSTRRAPPRAPPGRSPGCSP
ncbi:hypothetical protein GCM10027614_62310 [Micromonospora vulcania]